MKEQLAVVSIGYQRVLVPLTQATKIIQSLAKGMMVDEHYESGSGVYWTLDSAVKIGLEVVQRDNQVRDPQGRPCEVRPAAARQPKALAQKPLALERKLR